MAEEYEGEEEKEKYFKLNGDPSYDYFDELSEEEIEETVKSNKEMEAFKGAILQTDVGNADRLVKDFGKYFRYNCIHKHFLIWNGKYWEHDDIGKIYSFAEKTSRNIYLEAAAAEDTKERVTLGKWANLSQSLYRIKAMVELSKYKSSVPIRPQNLDQNPYLFNCQNKTLDLESGKLKDHDPNDYITKISPVNYNVDAECPNWLEYLNLIMDGNQDNITFLQKSVGYSLTAKTSERCFYFLFGGGFNGKTTFISTISALMGDYAMSTPTSTLMVKNQETIPNDLARLKGARFVSCDEGGENQRLNEGLIKQMTGQDLIKARFLHGEWFEYYPEFKIWFATNHKPVIRETTRAVWDRVREVPFTVEIPEEKRINDFFEEKLRSELSGILTWAKEGYDLYKLEGLTSPPDIKNAVQKYRKEMDVLQDFFDEFCIRNDFNELPSSEELDGLSKYDLELKNIHIVNVTALYTKWSEITGYKMSRILFGRKVEEKGYLKKKLSDGWYYIGIGLIDNI